MMNFWVILGALLAANGIWTVVGVLLLKSKMFQNWYMNYCQKVAEEMVDLYDDFDDED